MGFNVANVDDKEWYYTLYDKEYITKEANEQSNYIAFVEVIKNEMEKRDFDGFKKFVEGKTDEIENQIKDIFESMSKVEKKRAMRKVGKKLQNKNFAIQMLKDVQDELLKNEFLERINIMMGEIKLSDRFLRYYAMTSNYYNDILREQKHIPFIKIKDNEFIMFCMRRKYFYGLSDREVKNFEDNTEFLSDMIDLDDEGSGELDNDTLEKFLKRRYDYMYKRCEENEWVLPKLEMYRDIFKENYLNGFKCEYCNAPLRFEAKEEKKGAKNYEDLFTFEHRRPLSKGGVHSRDNLVISCMCCNIIKADMEEDLFLSILKSIDSNTKYKLYEYSYFKQNLISNKFLKLNETITKLNRDNKKLKAENKLLVNKI